jgi:creatinine amidohydrolase/Fe(II)-dependent formamide hydrolase-like protein
MTDVPSFDMLTGQSAPYPGFGTVSVDPETSVKVFRDLINAARSRIQKAFVVNSDGAGLIPKAIDDR